MMGTRHFYHISLIAVGLGASAGTFASVIYVKKGDKLSRIAAANVKGPVWGKKGSLHPILALNPQIKNPDLIFPGEAIALPGTKVIQAKKEEAPQVLRVTTTAEILTREPAAENTGAPPEEITEVKTEEKPVPQLPVQPVSPVVAQPVAPVVFQPKPEAATPLEYVHTFALIDPYYFLSKIQSTDLGSGAISNLTSQFNAGMNFSYSQAWSSDFSTSLDLKLGYLAISPVATSGRSLDSGSAFMDSVGIGACFGDPAHSPFFMKFQLADAKELFERAVSSTSVTVDAVSSPEFHLEPGFRLLARTPLVVGISFPLGVYAPTSTNYYSVQTGTSYGGKVFLLQDLGNGAKLSTEAGFLIRNQNTSITNQTQSDFGASVGISFPLGKPPEIRNTEK